MHAGGGDVGGALNLKPVHWRILVRVVEVGPVGRVLAVATSVVFASWALPRFYWRVHASGRRVRREGRVHAGGDSIGVSPGAEHEHDRRNQEQECERAAGGGEDDHDRRAAATWTHRETPR